MQYWKGTTDIRLDGPSAVTLGKFDGIHRGHQKLVRRVLNAKEQGMTGVVFTFDMFPVTVVTGRVQKTIVTNQERKHYLEKMGVGCLIEYLFTPEISHMDPERFVGEVLADRLQAKLIVVGPDFHFGYHRGGDCDMLLRLADTYGYRVEVETKVADEASGRVISSTYIREELSQGHIEKANELLGYPYFIQGQVLHGRSLGRTLGLPTINMIPSQSKLLPPNGVYVSVTSIEGKRYQGITNIGRKPTVGGDNPIGVETHLFGCSEDLYGKTAEVSLCTFCRPEKKMESIEVLKQTIERDVLTGKKYFEHK